MDEVDYSQFYYRPSGGECPHKPEKKDKKNKPPKNKKNKWVIFFAIMLCFAILFIGVDFFGKGILIKNIKGLLGKNRYSYYLVVSSHPTRDTAYAQSLTIKHKGGAGYVFNNDDKYYVALAVYTSEPDAKNVATKNGSVFFVHTIQFSASDNDTANLIDSFIRETIECCFQLEYGSLSENLLQSTLNNYSVLFEDLANKKKETGNDDCVSLLLFVKQSLSSINAGIVDRSELLFQLRYCLCSLIISTCDALS